MYVSKYVCMYVGNRLKPFWPKSNTTMCFLFLFARLRTTIGTSQGKFCQHESDYIADANLWPCQFQIHRYSTTPSWGFVLRARRHAS